MDKQSKDATFDADCFFNSVNTACPCEGVSTICKAKRLIVHNEIHINS